MKLSRKVINKYLKYLRNHSSRVGLSDYDIKLSVKTKDLGDDLATVQFSHLEKELTITLSNDLIGETDDKQMNVLLHELVHGRVAVMKIEMGEGNNEYFEELFVNDIVRGFERHKKLVWDGE